MNDKVNPLVSLVGRATNGEMRCAAVRHWLPGYLDGALPEGRRGEKLHARMARHLDRCASCRAELEQYRALSRIALGARTEEPPEELAVSIRMAVLKAQQSTVRGAFADHCKHRLSLLLDHVIEPFWLPVTGGALVALIVFGFVFPTLGGALHFTHNSTDLPISLLQPARLQKLAGFPLPGLDDTTDSEESQGLLVEATVNEQGQAIAYRVIGSSLDAGTLRQLDQVVFFSRFRPQLSFGRPTSSGRVILGFNSITVRG
jgi:hypothetical protein